MYTAPDNSKRIFVIEQPGRIKVFKDSGVVTLADTSTFLDLSDKAQFGSESGLLGMAFHPDFAQNGFVYVDYTRKNPLTTVISRFKLMDGNPNKLDRATEKILMEVPQPYSNHNAGSIIFGDDGYLYITLGDGGPGGDPSNRSQNKKVLLGKILRVDVNTPIEDSAYLIPPTNPFATNTLGWMREIYATGVRNPWKISKDPMGSTIWMADVGQGAYEEVDTLRLGANYGWKVTEGFAAYSACGSCDTSNYEKPILDYPRSQGNSITGGFVYRGTQLPRLYGAYIYGDYGSRKVWALKRNPDGTFTNELLFTATAALSSFGLDNENEIYVVGYSTSAGKLNKLRCGPATPVVTTSAIQVCVGDSITLTGPSSAAITGYQWSTGDTTNKITLTAPGNYSITLRTKNAWGCYSYSSLVQNVRIAEVPTAPNVPNVTKCESATVSLPAFYNYNWSTGSTADSILIAQSGAFWVIATDPAGCKSDTAFFAATIHPVPATPAISLSSDQILSTDSLGGATYVWLQNGVQVQTTSSPHYQPVQEGNYSVYLVSDQGCMSDTSVAVVLTTVNPVQASLILLLPSPFRESVELKWEKTIDDMPVKVEVYDAKGAVVKKVESKASGETFRLKIDASTWPKGTYTFRVGSQGRYVTRRAVKN